MRSGKLKLSAVAPAARVRPTDFILAVIICIGFGMTGAYLSHFILLPFGGAQSVDIPTVPYTAELAVLTMISMAVVPALFEEFVFRGVLLRRLAPLGSGFAIMASALMFGMIHGTLEQITLAAFMGAAAAYFAIKWNNIWIGVIAHFINNALVVTIQILSPLTNTDALNIAVTTLEVAIIAFALVAMLILLNRHKDAFSLPVASAPRKLRDDFLRSPALICLMTVYGAIIAVAWGGRLEWLLAWAG